MDLSKIGKFIQERRKAKKLTQVQLAQKIGVSEKTISKWECGNGFPDATLMLPLCEALNISANELLCGKLLSDGEYKTEAEQNLVEIKCRHEQATKQLLTLEWVVGYLSTFAFIISMFIAGYAVTELAWRIVLIVFGVVSFIVGLFFTLKIERDAGYYECAYCHHRYIPSYKSVLWSMHYGRTRYMKCPKCSKKSWQKKTISKD